MSEERDPNGVDGEWIRDVETTIDRAVVPEEAPSIDVVFDLMSRRDRRFVLYCLYRLDRGVDVPQLTDVVVQLAESSPSPAPTHDSLATRLRHAILPRLADSGVVVYDPTAGVVWPTDGVSAMEPLLEFAANVDFEAERPLADICSG